MLHLVQTLQRPRAKHSPTPQTPWQRLAAMTPCKHTPL